VAREPKLTDVEGCALGVVWQRGPCTAYEVRREFAVSSTPRWSASAGSIYPALQRLLARKLVRAAAEAWGPREITRYAITPRGLALLRGWIGPPLADELGGPAFDPLRTRSCFVGAMPRAARRRWVREAIARTRHALAGLRERAAESSVVDFEAMARRGSILELETRLRWLDELARAVGS
jgi:DNA-binding PadR family transcriptional regulator